MPSKIRTPERLSRTKAGNPLFLFVDDPEGLATPRDFLLKVPANIQSETDLLAHYAKAGHFPAYFGGNWNALVDCLRDFAWVSQKRIVIAHDDLPLVDCDDKLRIYLEILETAIRDWADIEAGPVTGSPADMPEHELVVSFPSAVEARVVRVLGVSRP